MKLREKSIQDSPGAVFHVSARVNWQQFLFESRRRRMLVLDTLRFACEAFGVEILAYVIMSNHFHAVLRSPGPRLYSTLTSRVLPSRHRRPWPKGHQNASVLAQAMRALMRHVARTVQEELDVTGRLWEAGYHASRITDGEYLATAIAYDHLNPLKAGMATSADEYEWSSARHWRRFDEAMWSGHGYRELPFHLERSELAKAIQERESRGPLRTVLMEIESEGNDWALPGGFEEVIARLRRAHDDTPCP